MVLERAEFGTDEGIVEVDVEARSSEQARRLLEDVCEVLEKQYDFERYR